MGVELNPIAGLAEGIMGGLDALFTSDEERAKGELAVQKLLQQPHLLQAMANVEEAKHTSVFVAGWRPALGWIGAIGLAYSFVLQPFIALVLAITSPEIALPDLDAAQLLTLVMSLLGLGGLRSYEKTKGVAR